MEGFLCYHFGGLKFGGAYFRNFTVLKFIDHIPDYLTGLSRALLRFFPTTFLEMAVYSITKQSGVNALNSPEYEFTEDRR